MRVKNSIKNIYISIVSQIIIILLGFISRKVFVDSLGIEYLGINGLLTNLISMLSLVESGIGLSIVYSLYKPLANKDKDRIIALVQLYKKSYAFLAVVIFVLGLILYPSLNIFMKNVNNIPYISVVYFIFIFRNVVSYLNAHKWSLINADQKGYILVKISLYFNIITTICKILILKETKNYILYLIIDLFIFILQNIINGIIVNKRYPYIKTNKKYFVDKKNKNEIKNNVKALFLHNIGGYFVFGTDNLLISAFIGIKAVGLYSNYSMIIDQLQALAIQVINGVGASIGNLIALEDKEKSYQIFKVIYLINFWIYSICSIFLYNLLEPFINWWLGNGYLINKNIFIIIIINFYITGLRQSIQAFKTKAGIFVQDKYMPLVESVINLGVSFILVKPLGMMGIFIGTTFSTLCTVFWNAPRLVYKLVFKKNVIEYFKIYLFYIILTIVAGVLTSFICSNLITVTGFISLIIKGIVCIVVPSCLYLLVFLKTDEFKYILNILKPIIYRFNKYLGITKENY